MNAPSDEPFAEAGWEPCLDEAGDEALRFFVSVVGAGRLLSSTIRRAPCATIDRARHEARMLTACAEYAAMAEAVRLSAAAAVRAALEAAAAHFETLAAPPADPAATLRAWAERTYPDSPGPPDQPAEPVPA